MSFFNFFKSSAKTLLLSFSAVAFLQLNSNAQSSEDISRWEKQASKVTIIRDNWGIPHIYGKSDADAVFGLMYAQCEDDFPRVEMNYIEKLGRISEIKGSSGLYDDLLIRMVIDSTDAKNDYNKAEKWLKKLMNAFADGINYYIYKHPEKKPASLNHFEPWYPLLWTDGSIGAINTDNYDAADLKRMYGLGNPIAQSETKAEPEPTGSNGFAFSPKITASGNAILYINPHVTFYFRPEVHMVSEDGLNVYGAVTWGQFFVYQGFNEHCGWMHTSSKVDAADTYIEKIVKKDSALMYEYDGKLRKLTEKNITISFKDSSGIKTKTFTVAYTHHGPIMARRKFQYFSVRADNRIMNGLKQCWLRNKATSFKEYQKTLDLRGNISNNTVYADAEGNIAYWHGNRVPVRDTTYNWNAPVDGTTSKTEWKGIHTIDEIVHVINPENGWIQNCNATPYTVAGPNSPLRSNYPAYMAPDEENFRGINAVRILDREKKYDLDKVIAAGYDTYMSSFEVLLPALFNAYDKNKTDAYNQLDEPMNMLKKWDKHCSATSIETTLAIEWGDLLMPVINRTAGLGGSQTFIDRMKAFAASANSDQLLNPMYAVLLELQKR